jgi:ABC-type bacteriocin/lantibiotic exporter with double-glycine peptidase domain
MNSQSVVDAIFTAMARTEERLHPHAVVLPNFPRSIQLDGYSCGAKSTYTVLRFFGKRCTPSSVEADLGTTYAGTPRTAIKRVLRKHGLRIHVNTDMSSRDLKSAINAACPVIVRLYDGWHYSVVYGYSDRHVFVMNPSLGEMGSMKCTVGLADWRDMFDRWGIVVSHK